MSWNGFPRSVRNKLVDKFIQSSNTDKPEKKEEPDEISVWLNLPYIGSTGEHLVKAFRKKMKRILNPKKNVKIKTFFKTTQLKNFTSTKDKVPTLSKSNVVYEIVCPGCGANYIGKTERTVNERTKEHATSDDESAVRDHIRNCCHFHHIHNILSMSDHLFDDHLNIDPQPSFRQFSIQSIQDAVKILDNDQNWNRLLYKEALYIERNNPVLNRGLKASRQLKLFK